MVRTVIAETRNCRGIEGLTMTTDKHSEIIAGISRISSPSSPLVFINSDIADAEVLQDILKSGDRGIGNRIEHFFRDHAFPRQRPRSQAFARLPLHLSRQPSFLLFPWERIRLKTSRIYTKGVFHVKHSLDNKTETISASS